jgi:hypothetical protein
MNIEIILKTDGKTGIPTRAFIKTFDDPAGCRSEAEAWCTAYSYEIKDRWVGPRGHIQEWEVEEIL